MTSVGRIGRFSIETDKSEVEVPFMGDERTRGRKSVPHIHVRNGQLLFILLSCRLKADLFYSKRDVGRCHEAGAVQHVHVKPVVASVGDRA